MTNKYSVKSDYRGKKFIATIKSGNKLTQNEIIIPQTVEDHKAIALVQSGVPASFFEWEEGITPLTNYEGANERLVKTTKVQKVTLGERTGGVEIAAPSTGNKDAEIKLKLVLGLNVRAGQEVFEASVEKLATRRDLNKVAKVLGVDVPEDITPEFVQSLYDTMH